jgi:predicted MPP superfamily phosphohydrolase
VPDFIVPGRTAGIDLILAGDTHGGQIWLPFHATLLLKSAVVRRYIQGHFIEGRTQMHVSRGIGTLYVPIRFLCPPEVTLLTLRRRSTS